MSDSVTEDLKVNSVMRDRKIYVIEEIDRDSMFKVAYYLDRLEEIDKGRKDGKKPDIEIVIDSYGGSIYNVLSVISKIESLIEKGYNIITTVTSVAMSAGSLLSLCGSQRRALRYSRIMFHSVAGGSGGKHQELDDDLEEINSIWQLVKQIITSKTLITDEQLEDIKYRKHDWFMWSDEALKLNVIDEII